MANPARWVLLAAGLVLAAGCTTGPAPPATTVDREVSVDPGSFFEANLAMNESAELAYEWTTANGSTVAFDVHSHTSTGIQYHERANGTAGEGTFAAPEEGTFSLLWENPAEDPATLSLTIEGDFEIESTVP